MFKKRSEKTAILRLRLFHGKSFSEKCFSENDLRKNILREKKREKKKIRKMFYIFQIRKTFYRKIAWFSVDQENVFRWPLIFREINTRKYWKHFPVSHFQWNKRTLSKILDLYYFDLQLVFGPNHIFKEETRESGFLLSCSWLNSWSEHIKWAQIVVHLPSQKGGERCCPVL